MPSSTNLRLVLVRVAFEFDSNFWLRKAVLEQQIADPPSKLVLDINKVNRIVRLHLHKDAEGTVLCVGVIDAGLRLCHIRSWLGTAGKCVNSWQ